MLKFLEKDEFGSEIYQKLLYLTKSLTKFLI